MNLALLLDMAAETYAEREAVSCAGRGFSYQELRSLAQATAQRVLARGARCIAFLDVNGPTAPVALYAAAYARVPYVPLNYRLTGAEIGSLLARLEAPFLVVARALVAGLQLPAGTEYVATEELLRAAPSGDTTVCEPGQDPDAIAVQLFTSGTTGPPKAAVLRHGHLSSYILGTVEFGGADESEAALVAVPPYHIAGISAVLSSTYAGRRIVVLPAFDAAEWLRLAAAERVTQAFLVPTMLGRIVELLEAPSANPPPRTLRAIAYGGGAMPRPVIERALRRFPGVAFTNAYGLTETSSTICLLGPDDHRAAAASDDPAVRARLGSVGRPLPAIEIDVRDGQGQVLAAGQPGVLFVRGAQVSGEYRDSGTTLDAEGWFATRDRGWIDAAGYVFLDGRADDVIVRGGENISPGEIEAVLRAHPAVADVAVLAVPSEEWGEAVGAVVVLDGSRAASVAELKDWVRAQLRGSRVPECVLIRDRLPYNDMGKLLRRELRREFHEAS
ncbi:MAG TPA: class I adenylate-forming enzyme family protein [Steroidobacteraceae bacterium]